MSTTTLDVVRLRQVLGRLSHRLRAGDGDAGLTPTQASLLFTVSRAGPIGLSELARREGIHPTQLSRSVRALESRGLLRRIAHTDDRRAASVDTTPAGRRLLRTVRTARTNVLRALVDELAVDELRRLEDALPVLELLVERLTEQ